MFFHTTPTYVPKHVEEMKDYTDVFVVCAFFFCFHKLTFILIYSNQSL